MLYEIIVILLHLSKMINGSLVIDNPSQMKNVYKSDYCPKMTFCPEGAHVMCMYYNPKSPIGPRCSNAQNISITPVLASKLLDVSNAVRSRIALGKEKGMNAELLPRGYGIFRLKWDSELATFAQVLANQCLLRHDLCRATKRFPDPGQTAGLVRFSYPDWFPVSKTANFTTPGLSSAKLLYASTQILKSWYGQKSAVTPKMITFYPDWTLSPNRQEGRLYLEMIYGSATHMGCGISAYTEYAFYDNNAALNYNSVQIICNYSARPRKGTAVYNTVAPGDTAEPFSRCGCPVGSEPDDDCLCQEVHKPPGQPPMQLKHTTRKCPEGQVCDPTVVLLPIFTVEDAPPHKLFNSDSSSNSSLRKPTTGVFNSLENYLFQNKRKTYNGPKVDKKPQAIHTAEQKESKQNMRPTSNHQRISVRNRYFDKKAIDIKPQEKQSLRVQNPVRKKTSVFTRVAKFELPETRNIRPIEPSGVKDVLPRKDFTNAKQLISKYLHGKNNLLEPFYESMSSEGKKISVAQKIDKTGQNNQMKEVINIIKATKPKKLKTTIMKISKLSEAKVDTKPIKKPRTETVLNTVEENIIYQDPFSEGLHNSRNESKKLMDNVMEESDNKLMTLLDTLEEEVKHVELRDKDKQVFDAKIRKIYGKVVGKPANLLDIKTKSENSETSGKQSRGTKDLSVITKSFQSDIKTDSKREKKDDWLTYQKFDSKDKKNKKFSNDSEAKDENETEKYEDRRRFYNNRIRGIKHSDSSLELMRSRHYYDESDDFNERKTYRNNDYGGKFGGFSHRGIENKYVNERGYRPGNNEMEQIRREFEREDDRRLRSKNFHLNNDANDDVLSIERRRFYQEKLDNIQRRYQMRSHRRRKDKPRHMRPMLASTRKSDNQMEIYGRARYAHGY